MHMRRANSAIAAILLMLSGQQPATAMDPGTLLAVKEAIGEPWNERLIAAVVDIYNCTIILNGLFVMAMVLTDLIQKSVLSQHLSHGPGPSHAPGQPNLGKLKVGGRSVGVNLEHREVILVEGRRHLHIKEVPGQGKMASPDVRPPKLVQSIISSTDI